MTKRSKDDELTPAQLAAETNRTVQAISMWTKRGVRGLPLPTEIIGGRIKIRRSAYEKWQADVAKLMRQRRPRKAAGKRSKRT